MVSPDGSQPGLKEPIEEKTTYENERDREGRDAESVAKMVFTFVSSATGLVTELDGGNDVQLLRLRTRKYEMVIVPGKSMRRGDSCASCRSADESNQTPNTYLSFYMTHRKVLDSYQAVPVITQPKPQQVGDRYY